MARKKSRPHRRGKRGSHQAPPNIVHSSAAGIDIGATRHFVAVPEGSSPDGNDVQSFDAFTGDLLRLADWLHTCGIQTIAMESTGVYWIPLFELLEERGFDVQLVDARKLKSVPGRKTDMVDARWIQTLHSFGLLSAAFRPDQDICILRTYLRQRASLISDAARHIQHMQKALTQMNLKLQHVISDISGVTGMRIIHAILDGIHDPNALAKLRHPRCKNPEKTIAKALHGYYRKDHLFELRQAVELFEVYQGKIAACDAEIEAFIGTFDDRSDGNELPRTKYKRRKTGNEFHFDARSPLHRMTGVDLTRIEGIDSHTALRVVAEIGLDMTRWPTVKHFTSWLGLCPGSKISGGKQLSSRTRPSSNRAAYYLRLAASSLYNSQTAIGAFLRRMKARLGAPKAITATAHKLARLVYSMLRFGTEYVDRGVRYYEQMYRSRVIRNLTRRAADLGYQLVPIPQDAEPEPA